MSTTPRAPAAPAPGHPHTTRRRRRGRAALAATALTAAAALSIGVAASASAATQTPTAAKAGNNSGLAWPSGAWLSNDTPATAAAFGTWRGRPLDVIDEWSARATWNDIVNPAWLYSQWQNTPYTMSFGAAMLPTNVPGVSLANCAAGAYNTYWQQFGTNIAAAGLGHSIIRLGWEFNGNWYPWAATQPATWVKCWQQIVTSARTTAPSLQWNWNVSRGTSSGLADPTQAWPGNSYVDIVGVDSYDWWPAANTPGGWNTQLNGTQGLNYWLTFAEAHGKKLAIPQWGSASTTITPAAGGDDTTYVNNMYNFFQTNAANIAYEANLQGTTNTGGVYWPTTTLPNAANTYQTNF